jgi:hypothetical protein
LVYKANNFENGDGLRLPERSFDERRKLDEDAPGSQVRPATHCGTYVSDTVHPYSNSPRLMWGAVVVFERFKEHHDVNVIFLKRAVAGLIM